jgi:large-conductance mechanosensitive channel
MLSSATYPTNGTASSKCGSIILGRHHRRVPLVCARAHHQLMAIIKEFREFIAKGNVIDLAVGVIIGAAFGNIVKSLTEDVVMPPIGKMLGGLGGLNFKDYFIPLDGQFTAYKTLEQAKASTALFAYGSSLRS